MIDLDPSSVLDAFLAEGRGGDILAPLRAPGRPRVDARGRACAWIAETAEACLRAVDRNASPAPDRTAPVCPPPRLLQAAISASKSDRRLAPSELSVLSAGLTSPETAETKLLRAEIKRPEMIDHLTRDLTSRSAMVEIYVVSRAVADATSPAANHYLQMLGARLGLERALTDAIDAEVLKVDKR